MTCAIGLLVACEGSFLLWEFTKNTEVLTFPNKQLTCRNCCGKISKERSCASYTEIGWRILIHTEGAKNTVQWKNIGCKKCGGRKGNFGDVGNNSAAIGGIHARADLAQS